LEISTKLDLFGYIRTDVVVLHKTILKGSKKSPITNNPLHVAECYVKGHYRVVVVCLPMSLLKKMVSLKRSNRFPTLFLSNEILKICRVIIPQKCRFLVQQRNLIQSK